MLEGALRLTPEHGWQGMSCDVALVVAVMQASEGALRQAGLHASATDFERLLHRFLRHRQPLAPSPPVALSLPPRPPRHGARPRRLPGQPR